MGTSHERTHRWFSLGKTFDSPSKGVFGWLLRTEYLAEFDTFI